MTLRPIPGAPAGAPIPSFPGSTPDATTPTTSPITPPPSTSGAAPVVPLQRVTNAERKVIGSSIMATRRNYGDGAVKIDVLDHGGLRIWLNRGGTPVLDLGPAETRQLMLTWWRSTAGAGYDTQSGWLRLTARWVQFGGDDKFGLALIVVDHADRVRRCRCALFCQRAGSEACSRRNRTNPCPRAGGPDGRPDMKNH